MEPKNELQRNALAEARRKELETYQRALDIQWLNSRMEDGRMGRCLALIQKEAEMEKDYQERTDHAAIVNARARKEIDLGMEVARVRREEDCELLRRHYLRERDPGLRQLMKKLQAGYVCRDLNLQMLNNQYKKLQDKAQEEQANRILSTCLHNEDESREHDDKLKQEKNRRYCNELQQQLVNRQLQRQCQYEEMLIEKKMLEEVDRTIAAEDQRELQQKREQTEKMQREMKTFQQAREAWKEKQKAMVIAEEKQIEEQKRALSDRSAAIVAERERKLREKEEINKRITDKTLADEAARQDRENIIKLLQEQEYLEKNVQDDIGERAKSERVKTDTKQALTSQMRTRQTLQREQREREAEFRRNAEAKIAADEEKERDKERKRREKQEQYARELLEQIRENAAARERNKEMEDNRAKHVWDCDKAWQNEVAEERKKIIEEHVPHVLGYLQAGVIGPADLAAARQGANNHQHLAQLDIESLATSNRPKRFSKCNAQCRILREY
ncbi:meiosis-specific nuclear structural protein 1-like [Maniola hyperantus]|uniref:meiosis-specific nuclear structural protein 1-like n=1 Tax=Aphantopus hyperantus TaxID=2795564 RepID=UPI001568D241|nr:meiosis-specific nuclear structural protein 1-like [Maniola hyperantus]